ncbi:MAG: maleylpyruvate isomerase family mycothiol-dependent enzyme [Mycobacteriales bacterium]
MDFVGYLDSLASDGAALSAAARSVQLDAPVPPCPGWSVRDLVGHTGGVHRGRGEVVRRRLTTRPNLEAASPPPDADLLDWYDEGLADLVEVLRSTDPAAPMWTWWPPDQTAGFWYRRMAQETVIHRVDAELAAGRSPRVEDDLAVDGVDEVLDCFLADDWSDHPMPGKGERLQVTTGYRSWLVTLQPSLVELTRGAGTAAGTVGGSPAGVLLWLWGRVPDAAVELTGDLAAVRLLREYLAVATE